MKTKRLKDVEFEYSKDAFPLMITKYASKGRPRGNAGVYTKREALALLRFLLEEMDLSVKQWKSIYHLVQERLASKAQVNVLLIE